MMQEEALHLHLYALGKR